MVDELMQWSHARGMFRAGSSHMTTDGEVADLHAFARRVGFERHLFHNSELMPHYDLTGPMRERAVAAGAEEVGWREQARQRLAIRRAQRGSQ